MSLNNNLIEMRIEERSSAYTRFRDIYCRLDQLIEALYRPGLYTLKEFEELAAEYRILQRKADNLEEFIRRKFPSKNVNNDLKHMKSNYRDDKESHELYFGS